MTPLELILAVAVGVVFVGGYALGGRREQARARAEKAAAQDEASRILGQAEREADSLRTAAELKGREEALKLREAWEREEDRRREELERTERRLESRSAKLDAKFDTLNSREESLESRSRDLDERLARAREENEAAEEARRGAVERLEALAGLTAEEARRELRESLEDAARAEAANTLREIREEAHRSAEREAKNILALAIQRMAAGQTAETTVSVVELPSDEMKGRIIGREGRNIRAFEQLTGIDVIIDDTPEAVILSGFDPVRREVARIALEKLIEDGRIHPGRIEEVVERSREEVEQGMVEAAEEVLYELGVHGVHPEVVRVLGRLRYRTSYGQNQLAHAREVAILAGNMAGEMGLDVAMAKRAGLLHDVGKGLTHEAEGTHVELGWRLAKKYDEPDVVLNSIRAHHDEEPHRYPEAFLVTAADAISGSRPGARREMFESYVKRLEKLEEIATSYPGVERCFAIQAGREVRVMVEPEKISDNEMAQLSAQVASRFEEELQYPGQIKVVVIRETRAIDFAR